MLRPDNFVIIADQATTASYAASRLLDFCVAHEVSMTPTSAEMLHRLADSEEDYDFAYDELDDVIDDVSSAFAESGWGHIGWHPEECGTLVFASLKWWDGL